VAAYRIVAEALTNVVRHGRAASACVEVALRPDGLHVGVRDDGTGVVTPRADGVGLRSMRERAEEIGGTFRLSAGPSGTTVTAVLPLTSTPASEEAAR
jgi:signal transduction histidine kinase